MFGNVNTFTRAELSYQNTLRSVRVGNAWQPLSGLYHGGFIKNRVYNTFENANILVWVDQIHSDFVSLYPCVFDQHLHDTCATLNTSYKIYCTMIHTNSK